MLKLYLEVNVVDKNSQVQWNFLKVIPGVPSVTGNITRVFGTDGAKPPAAFQGVVDRRSESAVSAAIYGREGIANCIDASLASKAGRGDFGIDFYFEKFNTSDSKEYWDLLGLETLAKRANAPKIKREESLGLSLQDCLKRGAHAPLRMLTVVESGGTGMRGALSDPRSILTRALMTVGQAQNDKDAAGSFGYGKAAVAQASRIKILFVYTCFKAANGDPATRRFLGVAYWGDHNVGNDLFTGWGLFGNLSDGETIALEDQEADALAEKLGLPIRDPDNKEDLGTTFVIVDPMFDADELESAIQLFWWPLLQQTREVNVEINIYDREVSPDDEGFQVCVDEDHPILGQFVERFREAETCRVVRRGSASEQSVVKFGEAGITSLIWSQDGSELSGSFIAKMRSPLMVVSYDSLPANPAALGVFVSHESNNQNLRRVEPKEHDRWFTTRNPELHATPDDLRLSKLVKEEILEACLAVRRADPPPPPASYQAFSRWFPAAGAQVPIRKRKPTGKKPQRLVRVHLVHGEQALEVDRPQRSFRDGKVFAQAEVKFYLDEDRAEKVDRKFLDAKVTIGARVAEDGSPGEWWPAEVELKKRDKTSKFKRISKKGVSPAVFEGRFEIGKPAFFTIETDSFPDDWSLELLFDCSPWDVMQQTSDEAAAELGVA
jgi:hypothetical protein